MEQLPKNKMCNVITASHRITELFCSKQKRNPEQVTMISVLYLFHLQQIFFSTKYKHTFCNKKNSLSLSENTYEE